MAVGGIVLGVLNLVGWALFGALIYYGYQQTKPARLAANSFIAELAKGDVVAAAKHCHSTMAAADLQTVSAQMKPWGAFKDVTFNQFNANTTGAGARLELGGVATFDKTTRSVSIVFAQEAGQWKVIQFNFAP